MRGFVAVFGREVAEWWKSLTISSLTLGLLAAVLPLGMTRLGMSVSEVRSGVALLFALLLSCALTVLLGGTILSSDLSEKRLGFYFARPLQGWSLWTGKMTAAALLAAGGGFLVLVPSLLLGDGPELDGEWGAVGPMRMGGLGTALALGFLLLFLLLASHALSVILRSRSPWIALDVAALGVVLVLFGTARERLLFAGVGGGAPILATDLGLLLILPILFAAGAVQILEGRTDIRRAHRFLSGSLWGLLLALMLLFEVSSRWFISAAPGHLEAATYVTASREGSWIALGGAAARRPGYYPSFLYDVSSGRFLRTRFGLTQQWWDPLVRFSADGRRAVWLEFAGIPYRSPMAAFYLDLDRPGAEPFRTSILLDRLPAVGAFTVSPDGRRLAATVRDRILVHDVETGRLLASVPLPGGILMPRLVFAGSDRLHILGAARAIDPNDNFRIFALSIPTARVELTGGVEGVRGFLGLSPEGDRAILKSRQSLRLHDARTGEALADLGGGSRASASFLRDGRLAVVRSTPEGKELRILAPDGRADLLRFSFPESRRLALADQPAPDRLRVVTARTLDSPQDWEVRLLDLGSGQVRLVATRPLTLLNAQDGQSLDMQKTGGVVWFDWQTGQERAILKDLQLVER